MTTDYNPCNGKTIVYSVADEAKLFIVKNGAAPIAVGLPKQPSAVYLSSGKLIGVTLQNSANVEIVKLDGEVVGTVIAPNAPDGSDPGFPVIHQAAVGQMIITWPKSEIIYLVKSDGTIMPLVQLPGIPNKVVITGDGLGAIMNAANDDIQIVDTDATMGILVQSPKDGGTVSLATDNRMGAIGISYSKSNVVKFVAIDLNTDKGILCSDFTAPKLPLTVAVTKVIT